MIRRFWKRLPRWAKIWLVCAVIVIGLCVLASYAPPGSSGEDAAASGAWNKELTDGAKAFYGPDWKPRKSDRRTIDAMAGEATKTYGAPRDGGDE
jgi:hypothetical protein